MDRSISIVEYKVQQAHFFLQKLREAELNFFAAQCFFDAFVAAARSITFSMQAVLLDLPGFDKWYRERQLLLRGDPVCKFFNGYRNISTHIGDTVLRGGDFGGSGSGRREVRYFFMPIPDLPNVPEDDVLRVCTEYFESLLSLVYEAILEFKYQLDDRWYFTAQNFSCIDKCIEDAEDELGFPRGWTAVGDGFAAEERWRVLRRTQTVGCQLNDLFAEYLGKTVRGPDGSTEPLCGC